jgi:hypothetical protein
MRSDPETPIWDALCVIAGAMSRVVTRSKGQAIEIARPEFQVVTSPKVPKRRKAKRDRIIEEIRKQTLAGHPPSFSVIVNRHKLPKATAHRWRQAGMKKARH